MLLDFWIMSESLELTSKKYYFELIFFSIYTSNIPLDFWIMSESLELASYEFIT